MHVAPPCSPVKVLRETNAKDLIDPTGWIAVNQDTLQCKNYDNIFAIGDCVGLPTSKTAAAICKFYFMLF